MSFSCTYTGAYGASLASISTPNVSVGRSRFGFNFRPISPGVFWYFFDTSSQPRKTKKNMSQLVVSVSGLFSSHHFHLFYFAGFFFVFPPTHALKKIHVGSSRSRFPSTYDRCRREIGEVRSRRRGSYSRAHENFAANHEIAVADLTGEGRSSRR